MNESEALEVWVRVIPVEGDPIDLQVKDVPNPELKNEFLNLLKINNLNVGKLVKRLG